MRARWLSRRAVLLHAALVVWFPGCLAAFWWQVHRATGGNGLSYLYAVEWPVFALVGVWAWWQLVHTEPGTVGRQAQERLLAEAGRTPAAGTPAAGTPAAEAPAAGTPATATPGTGANGSRPAAGTVAADTAHPAAPPAPGTPPRPVRRREDEDEALAAYNDRLARLASEGPSTWRRR